MGFEVAPPPPGRLSKQKKGLIYIYADSHIDMVLVYAYMDSYTRIYMYTHMRLHTHVHVRIRTALIIRTTAQTAVTAAVCGGTLSALASAMGAAHSSNAVANV